MHIDWNLLLTGAGIIGTIAATYARLNTKIEIVMEKIGNGKPGVFVRQEEFRPIKDDIKEIRIAIQEVKRCVKN